MAALRDGARTTPPELRDIIETDRENKELVAFINAASYTVDDIESAEPTTPSGLLAEVEKWLAAHLLTTRNELPSREDNESFSVEYLRETSYGEVAMNLDPSNTLAPSDAGVIEFSTPDAKDTR